MILKKDSETFLAFSFIYYCYYYYCTTQYCCLKLFLNYQFINLTCDLSVEAKNVPYHGEP